ncbi:MAG: hypothetical protein L6Q37_01525 [Bdellovibrionaceae bacterium]|nr:hypothetical protein [Pseudobdellovibrionaceae bacterium]NUM57107.1 hypothetical protein [Pseudobdellovibrionaceae bacterium]
MKLLFLSTLGLLVSIISIAQTPQSIQRQSQEIAADLKEEARYLSQDQIQKIARNLESIRRIMNNSSDPTDFPDYSCVSRDNDGRNPYVLGYRNGVDVVRIPGESFSTKEDCQTALASTRQVRRRTLLCVSRDSDGRTPYQLSILDGAKINKIPYTVSSDKSQCQQTLKELKTQGQNVIFCTSRDNDGRTPYIAISLNLIDISVKKGSETFTNISDCKQFLSGNR